MTNNLNYELTSHTVLNEEYLNKKMAKINSDNDSTAPNLKKQNTDPASTNTTHFEIDIEENNQISQYENNCLESEKNIEEKHDNPYINLLEIENEEENPERQNIRQLKTISVASKFLDILDLLPSEEIIEGIKYKKKDLLAMKVDTLKDICRYYDIPQSRKTKFELISAILRFQRTGNSGRKVKIWVMNKNFNIMK